ncbi:MAG: integrin alpha, partial [Thermoplasmata archaeon]
MTELIKRNDLFVIYCSLILSFILIIMPISVIFFKPLGSGSSLVTVSGSGQDDLFGQNVSYAGDVNGDGYDDIIVGAPGNDSERGRAYIFFGGPWFTGAFSADDANVTINGSAQGDRFGWDVSGAGNMNNDAFDDVIVGAPGNNSDTGAVYIFFGSNPLPPSLDANNADVVIAGGNAGDGFGSSVSGAGNVNNDDYDDVIIGSPGNNSDTGVAHVFCGANFMSGFMDVGDANVTMFGENIGDRFGFSVSGAKDVNDDDYDDVIVGAPGVDMTHIYFGG